MSKESEYIGSDLCWKDGIRFKLISFEPEQEELEGYLGKSATILSHIVEFGSPIYDIKFNDGVEEFFCFHDNIEPDYEYYREQKINDILDV